MSTGNNQKWEWGGFSKMIDELHACLKEEYQGGAFAWADETLDNAWTTAVNRFEAAIDLAFGTNDSKLFQMEMQFYKTKTLDLFNRYKKINKQADIETYLQNLKGEIK